MNESEFWQLIDKVDQQALNLQQERAAAAPVLCELETLKAAEIIAFYIRLVDALYALDTKNHFDAGPAQMADDSFLMFRCFIVGKGQEFYEAVLDNPRKTPKEFGSFETLLATAFEAWAAVTGRDRADFDYGCTSKSFETCSNLKGWFDASKLRIKFIDTRQSIEAMLAADRLEPATLNTRYGPAAFVDHLRKNGFQPKFADVEITLDPKTEHGDVSLVRALRHKAIFDVGFDAVKFVGLETNKRKRYFVEAASTALLQLHEGDAEAIQKIQSAKRVVNSL